VDEEGDEQAGDEGRVVLTSRAAKDEARGEGDVGNVFTTLSSWLDK